MTSETNVDEEKHPITAVVQIRYLAVLAVAVAAMAAVLMAQGLRSANEPSHRQHLLQRPARASSIVQPFAAAGAAKKARRTRAVASCRRPGPTNHVTNCRSDGLPAVEPTIATDGRLIVAAAADYDSYNGEPQFGFYWSEDGRRWNDAGPLDVFPHGDTNAGGDPLVLMDAGGVVYYAGMFFSYSRCDTGGVELLRRDPRTGDWARTELARNGADVLQDRPGFAVEGGTIFYAWSRFDSCEGSAVASRLQVALVPAGARARSPRRILEVPGSAFSQGAAPAGDGRGGFWLAWEEYPDATADDGSIKLAHWTPRGGWGTARTISPPGFRDLPEPLPGFQIDTSSVPAIAVSNGVPHVVWASAESGRGRISMWTPRGLTILDNSGGDQLLPAITADGRGSVLVSFSRANRLRGTLDRLLWHDGRARRISSAPTYPVDDEFFSGRFLGWVSGLAVSRDDVLAVWPDLRRPGSGAITSMSARLSPIP